MRGVAGRLLLLALMAATTCAMLQPVRSYDLWWHLASGRLITSEERIPRTDPFSFTSPATPWLDHEWLFQVAAYAGFRRAGTSFFPLATLAMGLSAYLLLAWCVRDRRGVAPAAWLLLGVSLAGARFRFDFRPEMVSYLFLAALAAIVLKSREERFTRLSWLACPLFALWANLHPAALLGAASLLVWLTGEWMQQRLGGGSLPRHPARLAILGFSPIFLLLNPGGIRLLAVPLEIRRIVSSGHAPNQEWFPPALADFPLFHGGVVLAACCLLLAAWVSRRGRAAAQDGDRTDICDWGSLLVLLMMAGLGMQQLRNIGFFFLILPLALARPVSFLLERAGSPSWPPRLLGGIMLALLAPVFARGMPSWTGKDLLSQITPEEAVRFVDESGIGQRLFNDVKFGGYLIWKRYPRHPVFIDGRNEVYDHLLSEIFAALGSWERWQGLLDGYRIDAAMLRRGQLQAVQYAPDTPGAPPRRELRAFSSAYFQRSLWALVYWDDMALVFVRRSAAAAAPLLSREYRIVNPDDAGHLLQEIRAGRVDARAALEEIDRKLAEDPLCASAQRLSSQIRSLAGASHP